MTCPTDLANFRLRSAVDRIAEWDEPPALGIAQLRRRRRHGAATRGACLTYLLQNPRWRHKHAARHLPDPGLGVVVGRVRPHRRPSLNGVCQHDPHLRQPRRQRLVGVTAKSKRGDVIRFE